MNKIPTTRVKLGPRTVLALALASALAIPAEGLRQRAYYDPPGILTVCYGDTRNVDPKKWYTIAECKARLDGRMTEAVLEVEACHPNLPAPVLAAFADAAYNIGSKVACDRKNSTAARYLYQGQHIAACNQLPRWSKSRIGGVMVELPGLAKRRAAEKALCLQGARA